jgi:hypothetical protein
MATTPDGSLLAAGYSDGRVELWNLSSGQLLASFKGEAYVGITAMAFTPDGKWLVAGDASGAIMLWDLERNAFHGFLFDPTANGADTKGLSYNVYDRITGHTITYTLPCGSPLPAGAVCTCNCVPGTVAVPRPTGGGVSGGTYCRCNKICTCVPISSRRWKTHVRPLTRTIDLVMRLEAMRYEWTPDAPHGRQGSDIGFIAEDVAAIVPEIVSIDADGRASGVDYARVTVLLVEAVKQQQKEIAALQTLLRDLVPQG